MSRRRPAESSSISHGTARAEAAEPQREPRRSASEPLFLQLAARLRAVAAPAFERARRRLGPRRWLTADPVRDASQGARGALRSPAARLLYGLIAALVLAPGVLYAAPALVGAEAAFVVLSGSMEPFLSPGDVLFVQEVAPAEVTVGTVITYRSPADPNVYFTHRVIEVVPEGSDSVRFRTKGDANAQPDSGSVPEGDIVGAYFFEIPVWGHLLALLRSKAGYFGLIVLPGSVLVLREFVRIYRELDRMMKEKQDKREALR